MKRREQEHSADLRAAQEALLTLRRRVKRLHFLSGGRGYDNMGARELDRARDKIDELEFWLGRASHSLYAGGRRAEALGFGLREPE